MSIDFSSFSVMDGSIEGVPLTSFKHKDLMIGIAGDTEASVQRVSYEAPFKKSALDYAASLLDIRGYTSAELSKKLEDRGYAPEDTAEALEKLKDYGYVNDEAFAQSFARRGAEAGKSAFRIETELRQKGLSREEAREAAAELKESDEARARAEAEKLLRKLGEQPDREKAYGKVSRKLASLGYTPSVIYSVMEDLFR